MTSIEAASAPVANLDVRPIRPVSDATALDKTVAIRDHFTAVMTVVLEAENVRANLFKSQPGNYPAWIRLEAWLPLGTEPEPRHERCELELIVEARPFNHHSLVCSARLTRGKQTITVAERSYFTERHVQEWTRYAIGRGPNPSNYRPLFDGLREKLGVFIPPLSHRYNPIDRQFRAPRFDVQMLVAAVVCAVLVIALIYRDLLTPVALGIGALTIVIALLVPVSARRYRYHDWVVPQPRLSPRHLSHVDSWHAVLVGLGGEADSLKQRLIAKLEDTPAESLDVRLESYGYRVPNGYEERERIVVTHRQGQVHVHVDAVGDNLFVGWNALLNWAQWAETSPVAMVDFGGRSIALRDVKPSWYYPDLFDLIALNSLSAAVHSAIEREVKSLLTELAIDQEVDFEVIRGDRENALDARKAWPERSNKRRRNSNAIFGSGIVQRTSAGEMQLAPIDVKPPGRSRGIAAIPAVILLPTIAALGYFWLYQSDGLELFQFEEPVGGLVFVFPPMLDLPLAVSLAIGLWLYSGIGLYRALLVIALLEATDFSTSYLNTYLGEINVGNPAVLPAALSSLCYLLAASVWMPSLRNGRRWLAAIVLWTAWMVATPSLTPDPPWSDVLYLGQPVFVVACFGFWLWREQVADRGRISTPQQLGQARRAPSRRAVAATRRPRQGSSRSYLLTSFDGRISRQTFWIAMGAVTVVDIFANLIAQQLDGDRLNAIVNLAFIYPELAIAVKRGHDRNMPFWLLVIFFAAGAALDLLTVVGWAGTSDNPSVLSLFIAVPFTIFGFFLLVELGFRKGTPGANRYGPDPLAGS